jgi:hypothetical protein
VVHALRALGGEADLVWHRETDLEAASTAWCFPVGLPTATRYAPERIARFSPAMREVARLAEVGVTRPRDLQRMADPL